MHGRKVGLSQSCRQGVSQALMAGQPSGQAAADSIAPQAVRLGVLGLPCFAVE